MKFLLALTLVLTSTAFAAEVLSCKGSDTALTITASSQGIRDGYNRKNPQGYKISYSQTGFSDLVIDPYSVNVMLLSKHEVYSFTAWEGQVGSHVRGTIHLVVDWNDSKEAQVGSLQSGLYRDRPDSLMNTLSCKRTTKP